MSARFHPELADAPVTSWNLRSIGWDIRLRRRTGNGHNDIIYQRYCEVGSRFACMVRRTLKRRPEKSPKTIFFGYDTGSLEILQYLSDCGIPTIIGQMDPNRVEAKMAREESTRWPGWALREENVPEAYFQRREAEWKLADRIVVNSRWSFDALVQQGVSPKKLVIIPLCYENVLDESETENRKPGSKVSFSTSSPLRVLFLGQVILRKGIQYLAEAARMLQNEPVHFKIVGPIGISREALKSAPQNMHFHGPVSRDHVSKCYDQSDVFVLPTISDGFAITQIEAMAHGLPVIATPNCGAVVTDGVDGFLVHARDATALAKAIHHYLVNPVLLSCHQYAAKKKATQFSIVQLSQRLIALESEILLKESPVL